MDRKIDYRTDWLEIFPEATPIVKKQIKEYKNKLLSITTSLDEYVTTIFLVPEPEVYKRLKLEIKLYGLKQREEKCRQIIYYLLNLLPPSRSVNQRITSEQIEQAKNIPLASLIPSVKRAGVGSYKATCPFHEDKKPSLSITESKNLWYCFVCCIGGTPITYVQKTENLGFVEAVKKLIL